MKKQTLPKEKVLATRQAKQQTGKKGTLEWLASNPSQLTMTHQPCVEGESHEHAMLEFRIFDVEKKHILQRITARIWEMNPGYGYMNVSLVSSPQDFLRNPTIMQYVSQVRDLYGEQTVHNLESMALECNTYQHTRGHMSNMMRLEGKKWKQFMAMSFDFMILKPMHSGIGFYSIERITELLKEINIWVRTNTCPHCYEPIKEQDERELACRTRVNIPNQIKDTAEDQTLDLDRFNADLDDDEYEEQERLRKEDEALQIERRKPPTPEKQQEMDQWIAERQAKTARSIADKAKAAQSSLKKKKRKVG